MGTSPCSPHDTYLYLLCIYISIYQNFSQSVFIIILNLHNSLPQSAARLGSSSVLNQPACCELTLWLG